MNRRMEREKNSMDKVRKIYWTKMDGGRRETMKGCLGKTDKTLTVIQHKSGEM